MEKGGEIFITLDQDGDNHKLQRSGGAAAGGGLARRLWAAALSGDARTVSELMALGAPFTTDWVGTGPLHCAARGGSATATLALLRAGAHTHARTKVERTALHIAAYHGHLETVEVLLEHMADPNSRDLLGMSALHWASTRGHVAVVTALLRHGADPNLEDRLHAKPADLTKDPQILELLQNYIELQESSVPADSTVQPPASPDNSATLESSEVLLKKLKQAHRHTAGKKIHQQVASPLSEEGAGTLRRLHNALGDAHTQHAHTLLSAMRHGRTLLLSDAGKILLKECNLNTNVLANSQPISSANQLTTTNQFTTVNQFLTANQITTSSPITTAEVNPNTGVNSVKGVNLELNPVTGVTSATKVNPVTGLTPVKGRKIVKMLNMRGKQNEQYESFTLKKIITPEDNQVKYVAVPRKCVVLQKVPTSTAGTAQSLMMVDNARQAEEDTLVQTQEELGEETEVMRLRRKVTSLRQRLAKYEPISDEEE